MHSPTISAMECRIRKLEVINRFQTCALLALLLACSLIFIMSAANTEAVPDVVQARSFEVVDAEGNIRVGLQMLGDRMPALALYDANGVRRLIVTTLGEGSPVITLNSENGKPRIDLGYYPGGVPRLRLSDESGEILFTAP